MLVKKFIKGTLALTLLCGAGWSQAALDPADNPTTSEQLRARMEVIMNEAKVPGVSYAVFDAEGIRFAQVLGQAEVASGSALTEHTRLRIGSVSKVFTALLTLRAIEQGRFSLDSPVQELLPEARLVNPYAESAPVRIVHLLEHTAGIDDMSLHAIFRDREALDPMLLTLQHDESALTVRWPPGTRRSYSNVGYSVLAALLEKVYQRDFEYLMQQQVLTPLGLRETVLTNAAAMQLEHAMGHSGDAMSATGLPPIWHRAAGSVWSTAHDLAQLGRFLLTDGQSHPGVLKPETVRDMRRVHTTDAARAGLGWGYGLGVFQAPTQGQHLYGHNGAIDGFCANLFFNLERGVGYAEIHNSDNTMVRPSRPLAGYLAGLPVTAPKPALQVQTPAAEMARAINGWYRTSNTRNELMRGVDWLIGAWQAEIVGEELLLKPLLGEPLRLRYAGNDQWFDPIYGQVDTILLRSADGSIAAIDTDGTHLARTTPLAVFAPVVVLVLGLLALVSAPFGRRRALQNPWLRRMNLAALAAFALIIAGLASIEGMKTVATVSLGPVLVFAGTLLLPLLSIVALMICWRHWRNESTKLAKWRVLFGALGAATISVYFASFNWLALALWTR